MQNEKLSYYNHVAFAFTISKTEAQNAIGIKGGISIPNLTSGEQKKIQLIQVTVQD